MTDPLSPLERAILEEFHGLYRDRGFPPPERVTVRRRKNTGAGRYVDLIAEETLDVDDDISTRAVDTSR